MANPISLAIDYLRSARAELEKVTWPSRNEVIRYSALVIGVCVILAAFFAVLDLGLNQGVTALLTRRGGSAAVQTNPTQAGIENSLQPGNGIEAVDANGNPVDVQVTPQQ
jgi:preprotein translocase subunit SecE